MSEPDVPLLKWETKGFACAETRGFRTSGPSLSGALGSSPGATGPTDPKGLCRCLFHLFRPSVEEHRRRFCVVLPERGPWATGGVHWAMGNGGDGRWGWGKWAMGGRGGAQDTNKVLAVSRIMVAWQPVGMAMGAYDMAVRYAGQRFQFGAPLAGFQLTQDRLAKMLASIQVPRPGSAPLPPPGHQAGVRIVVCALELFMHVSQCK